MHNTLFSLRGKVALVTGGSKGLGKAMAHTFSAAGADCFITSRHQNELESAAAEIARDTSGNVAWSVADQTRRGDSDAIAEAALKKFGRVDVLVNNAGSNTPQAIDQIKDVDWDRIVELNLNSCMALSRAPGAADEGTPVGPHHPHLVDHGAGLQGRPGFLLGDESGADRAGAGDGARPGPARDHRELPRSGSLPHRSAGQDAHGR